MSISSAERDKLRELLDIVLEIPGNVEDHKPERHWMVRDAHRHHSGEKPRIKNDTSNNPVSQLFWLLRECLLSHRWREVLHVFQGVTAEISDTLLTQWRVGCELFMSNGGDNIDLMQRFINHLKSMPLIDTQEVILEFVIYLIKHGQLDDASQTLQNLPRRHKNSTHDPTRLQPLMKAYQGVIHYTQWLNTRATLAQGDNCDVGASEAVARAEGLMKTHAQRAITCFSTLTNTPGVWDMFVDKHVKLLEYYGQLAEAEEVLTANCDTNPTNVNTHRYLLSYYKRHGAEPSRRICVLQKIVHLIPSDPAALDLVLLLKDSDVEACVPVLYDLLDYQCWQDDVTPWALLHEVLVVLFNRQSIGPVEEGWRMRDTWWPQYHFHGGHLDTNDRHVLLTKAAVAVLLMGSENDFSKLVQQRFGQSQKQREATRLYSLQYN